MPESLNTEPALRCPNSLEQCRWYRRAASFPSSPLSSSGVTTTLTNSVSLYNTIQVKYYNGIIT